MRFRLGGAGWNEIAVRMPEALTHQECLNPA